MYRHCKYARNFRHLHLLVYNDMFLTNTGNQSDHKVYLIYKGLPWHSKVCREITCFMEKLNQNGNDVIHLSFSIVAQRVSQYMNNCLESSYVNYITKQKEESLMTWFLFEILYVMCFYMTFESLIGGQTMITAHACQCNISVTVSIECILPVVAFHNTYNGSPDDATI